MHEKLASPEALKEKLLDSFPEHVPETKEFDMGYYEKPGNQKRWIESSKDLEVMYGGNCSDDISLWCDGRTESGGSTQKRKTNSDTGDEPVSKRARKEEEIEETFHTLRKNHGEEFSDPQLRLWARMYVNKLHTDLENPPNVPAITGKPAKHTREKTQGLTEALAGAAAAITKVLVRPSTPPSTGLSRSENLTGISPASKARLSGQYLEQLRTLQQLREN